MFGEEDFLLQVTVVYARTLPRIHPTDGDAIKPCGVRRFTLLRFHWLYRYRCPFRVRARTLSTAFGCESRVYEASSDHTAMKRI